jgi:hypothetical protein
MVAEAIEDPTYGSASSGKPKKCPECGHINASFRTTCQKCKTPLPDNVPAMRCPVCQCDVLATDEKCAFCGLPIEEVKAKSQLSFSTHGDNSIAIDDK